MDAPETQPANMATLEPQTANSNAVFVGRETDIDRLDALVRQGRKMILIWGEGGVGKTTIADQYLERQRIDQKIDQRVNFDLAKYNKGVGRVEGLLEAKLPSLGKESGRELAVSLERLRQALETKRIGILIDNLEPALERGCFVEEHRAYVELLRVLTMPQVQSVTLITSRERLYEHSVSLEEYRLRGLELDAWQEFFTEPTQVQPLQVGETELPTLAEMHKAYGGNAKAMEILRSAVREDTQGNLQRYWQRNQDDLLHHPSLENLIVEQFKRLQAIDLNAYNLLCRLGCYRYQDVPTVPLEGVLCLLWDVPEQKMRVVKALKDRALVEFQDDEYWLHPMLCEESVKQLKCNETDFKRANLNAAKFWAESVEVVESTEQAISALEPYYHYLQIKDFNLASNVLCGERSNKWDISEPLGIAFYRLGLLQTMINAINEVISFLEPGYPLSRLYNILGDLHWMTGSFSLSLKEHIASDLFAKEALANENQSEETTISLKKLECVSLFNRGLVYLDLYDFQTSKKIFLDCKRFSESNNFSKYLVGCISYLAFLNSQIGRPEDTHLLVNFVEDNIDEIDPYCWSKTYCRVFLGLTYKSLGDWQTAFKYYREAVHLAEECSYTQVKGKTLIYLAEFYREHGDCKMAITHHIESIQILDTIGARCDLAEAYLHFGLTYQAMGEDSNALKYRNEAVQLFTEVEAPMQVERVKLAFGNLE
jgi:tetratricopeptide (TPR) repeat protein